MEYASIPRLRYLAISVNKLTGAIQSHLLPTLSHISQGLLFDENLCGGACRDASRYLLAAAAP